MESLYRFAIKDGAGSTLQYPEVSSLWYYDLQLRSLATVYMRPRLQLEYKHNNKSEERNILGFNRNVLGFNWRFDPSCTCFKEIKTE